MSKVARSSVGLVGIIAILAVLPFLWHLSSASAASEGAPTADLASTMIRAGLAPEVLAAAGVSANQVGSVASSFATAKAAEAGRLGSADASYATLRATTDALRRKIESGLSTEEERASYLSQSQALTAATAERDDALSDYFTAATANLSAPQRATIATIKANRHWELPTEFLTVDRSEPEWVALRNALANERISAKNGDEPNPDCQSLLATVRANASVSAAKTNLDSTLAAVKASWTAAVQ